MTLLDYTLAAYATFCACVAARLAMWVRDLLREVDGLKLAAGGDRFDQGWRACEEHRAAHEAICGVPDEDAAFEAGLQVGISRGVAQARELEPKRTVFAMGLKIGMDIAPRCDCPGCRAESWRVN